MEGTGHWLLITGYFENARTLKGGSSFVDETRSGDQLPLSDGNLAVEIRGARVPTAVRGDLTDPPAHGWLFLEQMYLLRHV